MNKIKIGDIVSRKSYGGDIPFVVTNIIEDEKSGTQYVLRGLLYRIVADSLDDDLIRLDPRKEYINRNDHFRNIKRQAGRNMPYIGKYNFLRGRSTPGKVLHLDSSKEFMDKCLEYYREGSMNPIGKQVSESEQPHVVRNLLEQYKPDILVLTGHDALKKDKGSKDAIDNYRNSRYFISSVKEARRYQADYNKLCIFAGACQSYFEGIMEAGANFASSPGRVLINALDPAIVAKKVALTDSRKVVTPGEISRITKTGSEGIGGIDTKGHLVLQ